MTPPDWAVALYAGIMVGSIILLGSAFLHLAHRVNARKAKNEQTSWQATIMEEVSGTWPPSVQVVVQLRIVVRQPLGRSYGQPSTQGAPRGRARRGWACRCSRRQALARYRGASHACDVRLRTTPSAPYRMGPWQDHERQQHLNRRKPHGGPGQGVVSRCRSAGRG